MTNKEKVAYLRIALALQNISVNDEMCDRVIATYEKILKLKGKFSIEDAIDLMLGMDHKYAEEKIEKIKEGK